MQEVSRITGTAVMMNKKAARVLFRDGLINA